MTEVETTRVSTRGQIVIPQPIREKIHLEQGQLFAVHGEGDTIVLKRVDTPDPEEMNRLLEQGQAFAQEEGITPEDVQDAIAQQRAERT